MSLIVFFVITLGNVWIWKLFKFNAYLGILIALSTLILFFYLINKKTFLAVIFIVFLVFVSILGKNIRKPDIYYNQNQKIISTLRLNEYPQVTFLPIAHWMEEKPGMIGFYKILDNLSQTLNPNLYFFANHPRERSGITEVEKFPYILLPIFIYGIFLLISEKNNWFFVISFFIPLVFYSVFGLGSSLEPYLLFPFISVSIYKGFNKLSLMWKILFFILFIIVLIQSIIYAKF